MPVDPTTWETELRRDRRLNASAKLVAHVLAQHFRDNNGHCQRSVMRIASEANIVNLGVVRDALSALKLSGWLASMHVENTARFGLAISPADGGTG
jgi:hypothetical protein